MITTYHPLTDWIIIQICFAEKWIFQLAGPDPQCVVVPELLLLLYI